MSSMKKFDDLKAACDEYLEGLLRGSTNGLDEKGYWFKPILISDLLADREQLIECLKKYASGELGHCCDDRCGGPQDCNVAREALKKSDEIENESL